MNERLYYINLYDYYGDLLTDKQKIYFEDYYFNNYSLAEISENNGVTRNAVHKQIKEALEKLNYYEEKLETYKRDLELKKIINKIDDKKLKEELLNNL